MYIVQCTVYSVQCAILTKTLSVSFSTRGAYQNTLKAAAGGAIRAVVKGAKRTCAATALPIADPSVVWSMALIRCKRGGGERRRREETGERG